jgi:periplasmic protein TonB
VNENKMKTLSLSIFLFFIFFHSFSQKKKEEEIFTAVEQQAEFSGGMGAFHKLLIKNLPDFKKELNAGIAPGKIYIQIIIEKDGTISNIEILEGGGIFLETEKSFLQKLKVAFSEKWKPAKNKGESVKSKFTIPLSVCLSE